MNPPTKLLTKFCLAWAAHKEKTLKGNNKQSKGHEKSKADKELKDDEKLKGDENTDTVHNPATVALALSTCLVARRKNNALMHMTSGVEMLALAITICSEVCIFYLLLLILICLPLECRGVS